MMKKICGLTAALVVGAMLLCPIPVQAHGLSTERYFDYAIGDWCHRVFGSKQDTEGLCDLGQLTGTKLDLVATDQWPAVQHRGVKMLGVLPDMSLPNDEEEVAPFAKSFNDPANDDRVYNAISKGLDDAHGAGIGYLLAFTGMDTGEDHEVQYQRLVAGYRDKSRGESLIEKAERLGITIVVEMLNSKGDPETWKGHPGYLGDSTDEVVKHLIKPVGSDNFKLAFDVYHVAMMDEDPVAMAKKHGKHIGLIHAAGMIMKKNGQEHAKNRGELHLKKQQIDYPTVMAVLAEEVPEGTPVLMEYIPNEEDAIRVAADLFVAIQLCESKIKR